MFKVSAILHTLRIPICCMATNRAKKVTIFFLEITSEPLVYNARVLYCSMFFIVALCHRHEEENIFQSRHVLIHVTRES